MSAYSSNLRRPMIRNNSALRSEYNDSLIRDSGRADNRLHEQYKELDRARRVIEADLDKQKRAVAASLPRRASFPAALDAKFHSRLLAERGSADERLNKFLAQKRSESVPPPQNDGRLSKTRGRNLTESGIRRRAHTESQLQGMKVSTRATNYGRIPMDDSKEEEGEDESDATQPPQSAKRRSREQFFSALSTPKHPVLDKKAMREKIHKDMERTKRTQKKQPANDYAYGGY